MNQQPFAKFQSLLRELFQFDSADLDFGIYRIMNMKRQVIERFITHDLLRAISNDLTQGALAEQAQAAEALKAARNKVLEALGDDALDAEGKLAEEYRKTPAGREYLEAQEKAKSTRGREAQEAAVYNHLYAFFSRYYQDGDFISKRRYSKRERYAIPYNGEEVYLHWANHDQYYVKTGEYFTDYTWKAPNGVAVHFKLKAADVEQNNVKGEKRFFLPRPDEIAWDETARQLTIPFEFRPLNAQETITYGQKNQQDAIIAQAIEAIPRRLAKSAVEAVAAVGAEKRRADDGTVLTYLEYHLRQYTRRNTSDFFIHKDLRGFLYRELDFYLKNEVLNLAEMQAAGEAAAEGWFQLLRLIKKIGGHIIEFLAQIEDFQKMLWEKRKFVTETFYCLTVGNIPEPLYPEIAGCEAQWEEWKSLFHIDDEEPKLFIAGKRKKDIRLDFLKAYPTLVLDTRRFDPPFVDRLLAALEDLDELTDGLLVHSENLQALNLIKENYREGMKCIYIDPLYNTGGDGFLYKDTYQHSSWLAMLDGRLDSGLALLSLNGVLLSSIDDIELSALRFLFGSQLGYDNHVGTLVWKGATDNNPTRIAIEHEYIVCWAKAKDDLDDQWSTADNETKRQMLDAFEAIRRKASSHAELEAHFSEFVTEHREQLGDLYRYRRVDQHGPYAARRNMENPGKPGYDYDIVHPVTGKPCAKPYWGWRFPESTMKRLLAEDRIIFGETDAKIPELKVYLRDVRFPLRSVFHMDARKGSNDLDRLFGARDVFKNPKPVELLEHVLPFVTSPDGSVLDYFAGSGTTGHAVINLNREGSGRRKFILVEMADYFDTVLLPRIKKVTFTPDWKDGRPKRKATAEEAERGPRLVKVVRLESYEDSLNNIAFDEASGQQALPLEDYLLEYMFKWESRRSETLLNVEKLSQPFSYRLHLYRDGERLPRPVDLPETFNYLLGLNVQTRRVFDDHGRRYLVYRGATRDGRRAAVIWRDTAGWTDADYRRDKEFVAGHKLAAGVDEVYVNGDSFIPNARALEPVFKARMFAEVGA